MENEQTLAGQTPPPDLTPKSEVAKILDISESRLNSWIYTRKLLNSWRKNGRSYVSLSAAREVLQKFDTFQLKDD